MQRPQTNPNPDFWRDKQVLLTGHTGFKGSWLALWLQRLGAQVTGIALAPETQPNLFDLANIGKITRHHEQDLRDASAVARIVKQTNPDIVFHLAAQPLVRASYKDPLDTFSTNIQGTANLLDALRDLDRPRVAVAITTDKVYRNQEHAFPYCETDALGGHDPYSASKAAAELVIASYRDAFLAEQGVAVASARAGNVIGGGDWSKDRLIPDFLKTLGTGETLKIRSPNAIRPWQHVLEPLAGYVILAEKLFTDGARVAEAWNFGPNDEDAKPVSWIVEQLCVRIPGAKWEIEKAKQPHEAGLLNLDSSKAKAKLGWMPRWSLETALEKTVEWHLAWRNKSDMAVMTTSQIQAYSDA